MGTNNVKWYKFEDVGISVRVSLSGRPFRLDFFDHDAVEEVHDGNKDTLTNEDRVCPHITPKGVDFLGKGDYWKREIKNTILKFAEAGLRGGKSRGLGEQVLYGSGRGLKKDGRGS